MNVLFLDGTPPVPESQPAGDDHTDKNADQEEKTVGGKSDQQDGYHGNSNNQSRGAAKAETQAWAIPGRHASILDREQEVVLVLRV